MEKDFYVHGKKYKLNSFVGTAVEHQTLSESYTHGNQYGVSTNVTTYNDIFLIADDGKEKHFKLVNWGVPLRAGHKIQILSLYPNKKNGWYIAAYNINLDKITWCEDGIKSLTHRKYSIIMVFLIALVSIAIILVITKPADGGLSIVFGGFCIAFIIRVVLCNMFKYTIKTNARKELMGS